MLARGEQKILEAKPTLSTPALEYGGSFDLAGWQSRYRMPTPSSRRHSPECSNEFACLETGANGSLAMSWRSSEAAGGCRAPREGSRIIYKQRHSNEVNIYFTDIPFFIATTRNDNSSSFSHTHSTLLSINQSHSQIAIMGPAIGIDLGMYSIYLMYLLPSRPIH